MAKDIFDYIITQENVYRTEKVPLDDNWEWNMYEHIRRCFLYKNSKFFTGNNDGNRPFKNIIKPILNIAYRSEGFNVTDVEPYVDDSEEYYKSFVAKKFYPRWARKHHLDTVIDEFVESYSDYGLGVIKEVGKEKPISFDLKRVAFCDQTNFQTGAVGEKYYLIPDEIRAFKGIWNDEAIKNIIAFAKPEKEQVEGKTTKTPSKYIEVYEVHGEFREDWLDEFKGESDTIVRQMHVVGFYKDEKGDRQGISLFNVREKENPYRSLKRDGVYGRACGLSLVEELFEHQTWTNYSEIKIKGMLDQAGFVAYQTADQKFKTKNLLNDKNGKVYTHEPNQPINRIDNSVGNMTAFDNRVVLWQQEAQKIGSATEAALGKNPTAGTPFATVEFMGQEGQGIHEYRLDKIARFWEDVHRDWIMGYIIKDILKGDKFLEELTLDELESIGKTITTKKVNQKIKDKMFAGQETTPEEKELMAEIIKADFEKGGQKRFIEIIKDEFKTIPMDVRINIKGRQKDMVGTTQKLVNIFRQVIAAPEILKIPEFGKLFNEIIEFSGLSPIMFSEMTRSTAQPVKPAQSKPVEDLQLATQNNGK